MMTNVLKPVWVVSVILILSGCSSVPISNAGFSQHRSSHSRYADKELTELDVLGIPSTLLLDDDHITKTLSEKSAIELHPHSKLLLLQSGTDFPDSEMVQSMSQFWDISVLSGDSRNYPKENLNTILRYTAATGGNDFIVVYWGVIQSAKSDLHSKNVSWIPMLGWSLPDEETKMRVIVKFAIIDVKNGQWKTFQAEPIESAFLSSIHNREGKNQVQEIEIKRAIYAKVSEDFFNKFSKASQHF